MKTNTKAQATQCEVVQLSAYRAQQRTSRVTEQRRDVSAFRLERPAAPSELELWRSSLPVDLQKPDRQLDAAIVRAHCQLAREKVREAMESLARMRLGADCAAAIAIVGGRA